MRGGIAKLLIHPDASLLEAVKAIEVGGSQIAIVADEHGRLLGTVTDGDVRRGILGGIGLEAPVERVMNREPRTLSVGYSRESAAELMRRHSIHQLPVVDAEQRVVGVEYLDDLISSPSVDTWVVLMAGGQGTRLRPLTDTVPKPMIPVGGRPLLETIVKTFEAQGFRNIFLSVNYKSEIIREHFGDGLRFGVSIEYLLEDQPLGTAGALSLLPRDPPGPLIVMNADLLTSINFRQLVEFHTAQRAHATMCVRQYAFQVPYGVVHTDGSRLTSVIEKPVHNFFVSAGIYVVDFARLKHHFSRTDRLDMPQLFEKIAEAGDVATVFPIHEYWLDIGRMDDLERAQSEFQKVFER